MAIWDTIGAGVKAFDSLSSAIGGLKIGGGSNATAAANPALAALADVQPQQPQITPFSDIIYSLQKTALLEDQNKPSTLDLLQTQADQTFQEILRRVL